jgi:AmmeMemoRadiSam system protein B
VKDLDVRPSPIAGTWYDADPAVLARQIDGYLNDVPDAQLPGELIAVIAPHAGHKYSGPVAAHAFQMLRGLHPALVAVISPYHNAAPFPLITTAHEAYSTPLGNIEVNRAALVELQDHLDIPMTPISRDHEHSLEIELPFLQRVLKDEFTLLPIMIRAQEPGVAQKLGDALAHTLEGKNALMVASTDLSHFYDQDTAQTLDQEMLKRFESMEPDAIFEAEHSGRGFACGHAAVAAVLTAARSLGADAVKILHHATSGDVTGDLSSVVGYGAAVVLKTI